MTKKVIATDKAPQAIGPYSQAIQAGDFVYFSGQIPLVPETMKMISDEFEDQARQMFQNLSEVIKAAGASKSQIIKINLYLTDLSKFKYINEIMAEFFEEPYPARAAVEVSALPAGALVEAEAVAYLGK
ncbi:Rid family detoxifying hydrolase [Francisellaceae bacterium]|nr:Rid family detoxifying hydrolase [Francisellaceae bacterium]